MDKIIKFFIIVIAGLWITGFTLSIFRPEFLEGILGNVIGITFSALIILGVLSYLFIFIRDKEWLKAVLLILGVILLLVIRSGSIIDLIKLKQDIRPKPRPILQEVPDSKSPDMTVYMGGYKSSNALDGTSIICESYLKPNFPKVGIDGFRFENGSVKRDRIVTNNNKVRVKELGTTNSSSYYTSTESISWWGGAYELNRKTLILYSNDVNNVIENSKTYNKTHSCKVYSNLNEYSEKLKNLVIEQEKEIEKRMSGNKI